MKISGQIQAAIEITDSILKQHRPVSLILGEWFKAHRFAGSSDRAKIAHIVYDTLRRNISLNWLIDNSNSRIMVITMLVYNWDMSITEIQDNFSDDPYAPQLLDKDEIEIISGVSEKLKEAPEWVKAEIPEWIWPYWQETFKSQAVDEGKAFIQRPNLDIRVNILRSNIKKVKNNFLKYSHKETLISPWGIRIKSGVGNKHTPNLLSDPDFARGWFEVQDESSQIASILCGAKPSMQILDYCAGSGGKALALAAAMENKGQIYTYDYDPARLSPIYKRIRRARVHNIQVITEEKN